MIDFLSPVLYSLADYIILQAELMLALCVVINYSSYINKKFFVGNVCYWLGCIIVMTGFGIFDYAFKLFIISYIRLIAIWLFSVVWLLLFVKESFSSKIFKFFFAAIIFFAGHSFCNIVDTVANGYNIGFLPWLKTHDDNVLVYTLIVLRSIMYYSVILLLIYFCLRRFLNNDFSNILNKQIICLYGLIAAITVALTIVEISIDSKDFKYYLMMFCFEFAFAVLELITVVCIDQKIREEKLRIEYFADLNFMKKLWQLEKKQYEFIKTNIDTINTKCHDMRHIIKSGGAYTDAVKNEIGNVENAISAYDSMVNTGNAVFDVVLSEKSIECFKKDINLFCMADGSSISFLDEVSVYSIFGNAIENAMQYVDKFTTEDKRFINVNVRKCGTMAVINVENVLEDELEFKDGLPATNKQDSDYHGFGMKSMRATAEKYGGEIGVFTDGGMFRLSIVIPII